MTMEYEYTPYEMASKLLEFNRDFSDDIELLLEEAEYVAELFEELQKSERFEVLAHYLDRMFMDDVFKNQLEKRSNCMKYTKEMIENVSCCINPIYIDNLQATKELMELFDDLKEKKMNRYIAKNPLETYKDYVKMYDESFYTYTTFEELVESEEEQNEGMTEEECREQINNTIWQLPCGWYVQYV